jgi:RNA polymerase sigma factor (sigma-70 family)
MIGDTELLRRFAEVRSEDAFAELATRYLGFVYHSALRRVNQNTALAEEVAQAVFVSLARDAARLSTKIGNDQTLAGWLFVVTRHAAANAMRAEARRAHREIQASAMHAIDHDGSDAGKAWSELRPELETVMDALSSGVRDAVLLRYFENRPFEDVGAALGISPDAARVRVNRALEKMRQLLARRKITSTAAALGGLLASQAVQAAPAGLGASITVSALSAAALPVAAAGSAVWIFMTKTKVLISIASAAAAVAVGTVLYRSAGAEAQARETDALRLENARLAERISALEKRAQNADDTAQSAAAALKAQASAGQAVPPALTTPRPGVTVKAPSGWFKNGAKPESYVVGVDSTETWGGMPSAYVESLTPQVEGGFGGMMQTVSAEAYIGKRVRLSGWLKTKDANEGGGHLWLRIDSEERAKNLGFDNMNNRPVRGTSDWQEASVVLDVPIGAKALAYGFFVKGGGKLWVSGQMLEVAGQEVPVTNMRIEIPPEKALRKAPANLGFDPNK